MSTQFVISQDCSLHQKYFHSATCYQYFIN